MTSLNAHTTSFWVRYYEYDTSAWPSELYPTNTVRRALTSPVASTLYSALKHSGYIERRTSRLSEMFATRDCESRVRDRCILRVDA